MASYRTLSIEWQGNIPWLFIDQPDTANALSKPFWEEFPAALRSLSSSNLNDMSPVNVIVIAGRGKHFSAGADLALLESFYQISQDTTDPANGAFALRERIAELQQAFNTIETINTPVIAAVDGVCIGAGLDLIAACDMRFCTTQARFALKEVDFGIVADVGAIQRLTHLIGLQNLNELTYKGDFFSAGEAREMGLVGAPYADRESLYQGVQQLAEKIAAKHPLTVRGIKRNILYARDHNVADGLEYVATWNASTLTNHFGCRALSAAKK